MAIQKKTEGRDLDEYLQEVWDSLEPAWDKSKFDMKQGYDSEYECDCITITSKDNEGVRAKIYVNDYEGRHPVGFDVVYRYPGDKGVGVMGSYEFQSTDMDNLGEEVFDYFDEIKKKAAVASFESDLQAYADAVKADKYDKQSVIDDGWEFYDSVEYDADIVRDDFKQKYAGKTYLLHITFNPSTKDVSDVKWDISAIESKQTEADATFKVGDFVNYDAESDGKDVYDSFVPCEVVGVNDDGTLGLCVYGSYADEEGLGEKASASCCSKLDHYAGMVDANTYYTDGKYKAYKGGWEILVTEKELDPKVYEFIGTMDDLSEVVDFDDYYGGENFVYDEDLRDDLGATGVDTDGVDFADMSGDVAKASGSPEESKKSEGLPPKKLGDRKYRSRADLINKMKQLGATEITTRDQYDELRGKQWLHKGGYAMDINGNLVGQTYFGDKDGKWYYASSKTFQGDYLPESKQNENRTKEEEITNIFKGMKDWASKYPNDPDRKIIADNLDLDAVQDNMSAIVEVMDKAFEWGGYDYKYPVKDYGDDDDARDAAEASQWDACYSVCEEIADIIGVPDEGHSIGEMNIYFWEEIEQTFTSEESANKTEAKKSKSTDNTTESERISFIQDLANKLGIDNLEENRASAYMSGWRYFNNDDEGGDGVVLSLKAYPWARTDQSAEINVWLESGSGVIGDCWLSFDFGGDYKNLINADKILTTLKTQLHTLWSRREGVAKKSESLTLKQKELKDMARFGQAEDITTISDEEAKALRKKGIETVGISRGTYGMNGALLRDNEGKKYVITARSSNLFYFV